MADMTKEDAISAFRKLINTYGIQWRADVPPGAWELLNKCNEVMTMDDRRAAVGLKAATK